jgi:hypothetical protein
MDNLADEDVNMIKATDKNKIQVDNPIVNLEGE